MNHTRITLSRIFIGLIIIAIGVGYLGNALWNWNFEIFFKGWWTLFLILPSLYTIIKWRLNLFSILLIALGILLLLHAQALLTVDFWAVFLPVLAILVGLYIIFGKALRNKYKSFDALVRNKKIPSDTSNCPQYLAVFGSSRVKNISSNFLGGETTAIFGGISLDLHSAIINQNITLEANSIFGSIEIFAPENVKVELTGFPVFGKFSDKGLRRGGEQVLRINCFTAFGGITIK
ncbi:MAG: hypothetical protein E7487_07975 [Ruminococcaceae bacterium]|nr:hypothetical protein [Oscillospiraceae bacterium]